MLALELYGTYARASHHRVQVNHVDYPIFRTQTQSALNVYMDLEHGMVAAHMLPGTQGSHVGVDWGVRVKESQPGETNRVNS